MQFTTIARDVGEDARMGRLYLPMDWMIGAGLDPEAFMADPRPSPELAGVVARLLSEGEGLYRRAEAGIAALPSPCRPAIRAAALIYAEIGRVVARQDHDSVSARARVGTARKLALIAHALRSAPAMPGLAAPPLPEMAFLIDAVMAHAPVPDRRRAALRPWWDVGGRVVHVLELIERMREREAFGRSAPS
jgi:phytoene synthase